MIELLDKVKLSIERLKHFEPEEGYYLAFSGGKDSQVLYHLAVESGVKFDAHFHLTTVDSPELIRFVRGNYPGVMVDRPQVSMWRLIEKKLMPPTRVIRYCCYNLKERGGEGREIVLTGIRAEESVKRGRRNMFEPCKTLHNHILNPIIDWTEFEVWEFIRSRNLNYCELYDQGWGRIGCIMCPAAGNKNMARDAARWPKYRANYILAFDRMILERKRKGLSCEWENGEQVMSWWIKGGGSDHGKDIKKSPLFFDADLGIVDDVGEAQ